MPIRSLLSETSFNSDQTEMIAKAFDESWAELQCGQAEPAMSSLVRTALAKRIIETAQREGMTAETLRDDAIAHIKNNPLCPLYRKRTQVLARLCAYALWRQGCAAWEQADATGQHGRSGGGASSFKVSQLTRSAQASK